MILNMWFLRATSTLFLINLCLVASQQDTGRGDFGKPSQSATNLNDDYLGKLISDIFNSKNTSSSTYIGTQNQKTEPTDCKCVPYYQCMNLKILDNGLGLIDIRFTFPMEVMMITVGSCKATLDVCCKPPDVIYKREDTTTPPPIIRKGCGQRNPGGVGVRIAGYQDNQAQFGEFPWMVAILRKDVDGNSQKVNVYQCGGALIHRQAVLTAAHCVNEKPASSLKIRAGEWDTQADNEIYPHQDRDVQVVVVHEGFHSGVLYNDFAILILKKPVDLAENVDVVCLPDQGVNFDGSRCVVIGWGKDVFGEAGKYQGILKRVELPIVSHNPCQNSLRTTRLGKYFVLDNSFICAGGEPGIDSCKGDGGSPLVCPLRNDPTRYVQAGIVAWGISCGKNSIPGVYANVAGARQWIDKQLVYNNLN